MELINYQYFDEQCYFEEMPNGLKVYVIHKPDYVSSTAAFGTPYGALDIHQLYQGQHYDFHPGIAHFLEHKVFEDEQGDVIGRFTELGANVNAFTTYQETVYHFFLTGEKNFAECLNLLLDFVQSFNVSEASVENEKAIINQELAMYLQSPVTRLLNETYAAMYHNFPLKYDIGGNEDSVNAITKNELETCYKINYHPSNMVLSIISFINPEIIFDIIRQNQAKKHFKKVNVAIKDNLDEPNAVYKERYTFNMDINASKVVYAIKLNYSNYSDDEQVKAEFLISKYLELCFSSINPEYQKWLDQGIINDFFGCELEIERDYAYILFYSEQDDVNEFKAFIDNQIKLFKPNSEQFNELKRRFVGEFFSEFNDIENLNITFIRNVLDNLNMFKVFDLIMQTSFDDMLKEISKINWQNYSLVSLLPKNV